MAAAIEILASGLSKALSDVPNPAIEILGSGLSRNAPTPRPPAIEILGSGLTRGPAPSVEGALYGSLDGINWIEIEVLASSDGTAWDITVI